MWFSGQRVFLPMQETWVLSLVREDPLEREMTTWRIPWTEELGELQSMGSQRVGCNLVPKQQQQRRRGGAMAGQNCDKNKGSQTRRTCGEGPQADFCVLL